MITAFALYVAPPSPPAFPLATFLHDRRSQNSRTRARHRRAAGPASRLDALPRSREGGGRTRPAPARCAAGGEFPDRFARAGVRPHPVRGQPMTDLAYLSLADGSALLRAKKLSPVEWTRALLDRVAAVDPAYNAFLVVTAELALAQAKAAEAEIAKGNWRGPMHGVPYAAKDIFDIEGMTTTCHSKVRVNHRAAADAFVVKKLRDAG